MVLESPERVLLLRLATDPSCAAVLGFRIYPLIAPTSAEIPFVVYQRTAIEREGTLGLSGVSGVPKVTVAFEIYGVTYEEARTAANAMRAALDGWTGTHYGVVVSRVSADQETDELAALDGGELPPVYQVTQSYEILWQEA
jgi:hypothetical protein